MVDRIDKSIRVDDPWKIQSTAETYKEKGDQESSKDEFSGFQEKTDWNLLFDRSKLWKKNIQLQGSEIQSIVFRKINLKTDPSLLRIDVVLNGGEKISPAFLAISRAQGLQIKNLHSGDLVDPALLLQNESMTVTIPTNPDIFKEAEAPPARMPRQQAPQKTAAGDDGEKTVKAPLMPGIGKKLGVLDPFSGRLKAEITWVYGIGLLIFSILIWGFFLLR